MVLGGGGISYERNTPVMQMIAAGLVEQATQEKTMSQSRTPRVIYHHVNNQSRENMWVEEGIIWTRLGTNVTEVGCRFFLSCDLNIWWSGIQREDGPLNLLDEKVDPDQLFVDRGRYSGNCWLIRALLVPGELKFKMETPIIYKLGPMKFTTQNDLHQ